MSVTSRLICEFSGAAYTEHPEDVAVQCLWTSCTVECLLLDDITLMGGLTASRWQHETSSCGWDAALPSCSLAGQL